MIEEEYDLAFSFAGEHRQYVEEVKYECEKLGLKVFYDRDKNNEWWGQNFISKQREVYGEKTRHFVPFISPEYFDKSIPLDEFEAAMQTALEKRNAYILPVVIGNTKIPKDKLHPQIHYLKAEEYTPKTLAQEFYQKIKGAAQAPKSIGRIIDDAISLRTPRLTPKTFSKYKEREATLKYLSEQFQQNLPKLEKYDLVGTAQFNESSIRIRVEDQGKTVCGLNIFNADSMSEAALGFNRDHQSFSAHNNYQGFIRPFFDTKKR